VKRQPPLYRISGAIESMAGWPWTQIDRDLPVELYYIGYETWWP
jgi:hypothetical protein